MEPLKEALISRVKNATNIADIQAGINKAEEFTYEEIKQKVFQKSRENLLKCISIKNRIIYIDYQNNNNSLIHKDIIINIDELYKSGITRIECINVPKDASNIRYWNRIYLRGKPGGTPNPNKPIIIGSSPGGLRLDSGAVDNVPMELYNFSVMYFSTDDYNDNIFATLGHGVSNVNEFFGSDIANQIYKVCTNNYKRPKQLDDLGTILQCKESVDIVLKFLQSKHLTNKFICDKNYDWFGDMTAFAICTDKTSYIQIKTQYFEYWSDVKEYNFDNNITVLIFKKYDLDKYKGIINK